MGMREKMIELLMQKGFGVEGATIAADHLIANGVTIPVRCKECAHMVEAFGGRYCKVWTMFNGMGDDGFCNYGERKSVK